MNKPPYRVPSMEAIAKVPWNGLTVASTFSGCGGSCLGYKMAGFRVVWANEFVPIAQECYRANFPDTILDPRDIHQITAAEILKAIQMRPGELDVLDGSPPCQAFSTAGKREKGWGKKKEYEHGAEQCNETLFNEYIRLLRGLQPRAFVAENVSGLAKGTAKGFFLDILAQLKASGYRVKCGLLDAQWLGVPQSRQRIFFVGIREDLAGEFHFPRPLPYRYSIADALPHILGVQGANGFNHHAETPSDRPAQAFQASSAILKARVIHDTRGLPSFSEGDVTDRPSPAIMVSNGGGHFKIVYSSGFNRGSEDSVLKPVPAIMAGGLNGSGHGQYKLQDRDMQRRLTIQEVKALCSFPEDFKLVGTYAQQWARLGNCVPPFMARAVGEAVRATLKTTKSRPQASMIEPLRTVVGTVDEP